MKNSNLLLLLSLKKEENQRRYSLYLQMSNSKKNLFRDAQEQETGLSPEQVLKISLAKNVSASATVGNSQKRVQLKKLIQMIIQKKLRAIKIPLEKLSCLDSPYLYEAWGTLSKENNVIEPLTLRQLVSIHIKKIFMVDLDFPIIVLEGKTVLDGWHRVAQACYKGEFEILAFNIDEKLWDFIPNLNSGKS